MITLVVFSMNRAMQCESLLRSLCDHATGIDRTVVIARATSSLHQEAYAKLTAEHPECQIVDDVRGCSVHLAQVLANGTDHVSLAVDDQLFYRSSDFSMAARELDNANGFVWSWRLGEKLGTTQTRNGAFWQCSPRIDDADYGYLFHSDGAVFRANEYMALLDLFLPGWRDNALIPNNLEGHVAACQHQWRMSVGPHLGPLKPTCITWQINKESTTREYGAPWVTIPETELDTLAQAFLAGKRVDNQALYADLSWVTRFQKAGDGPTHISACVEASRFYAGMIR